MRKKGFCFACAIIASFSLIGCGLSQEESVPNDVIENPENVVNHTIVPLPVTIDLENLDDCTVAVSLEEGDAYVDDAGAMQLDATIYAYDLYDMVDIASLQEGDTIVIREQEVLVDSIERTNSRVFINGGIDENGYELYTDNATVWYESGYSDVKSYYEIGKKTIRVSADMIFYDNSDLDKGEIIYYPGDFLADAGIEYHFVPDNTSIVIQDGMIIEIHRNYMA